MKARSTRCSRCCIFLMLLFWASPYIYAQSPVSIDSMWAPHVPPLPVPELYLGPAAPPLPFSVDNSLLPYFRPIFNQVALECGQAAGVAYTYTYEIDRLRNVAASSTSTQYPTHWVWNFSNNGVNAGISFFESWDIIRQLGTPNVQEWGGSTGYGGQYRWISGYNTYYSAMKNRLGDVWGINLSDTAGISILKHWLHDRLEGASTGGVAAFYAEYTSNPSVIPSGIYGAGKHVIPSWGGSPNHAMTVVGYDDSIRWDYNSDGLYTNHLDINGDGYVTLADWEIGAFKLANSYGGVPAWGDNGFCYFMYNTLARPIGQGGIWNQTVYVIEAIHDYSPLLTLKAKIKYPSRECLKISVGLALDTMLFSPQYTLDFPAFRFQGGNRYMQGGTSEADKTIEIGLDLTPLLSYVQPGVPASFFLIIDERDPNSAYLGEVLSLSLMDYSGPVPIEKASPYLNVPILNNMRSVVPIPHSINFSKPQITDTLLPVMVVGQPFQHQITATQGLAPYEWEKVNDYSITSVNTTFPGTGGNSLGLPADGRVMLVLPFSFPFYGKNYDTIWVYTDGYITFDDELYPWPYLTDETGYMRNTRCIAPFMYKGFTNYSSVGDGAWKTILPDGILIRWNTSQNGLSGSTDAQFAVKLSPDGSMRFYYGNVSFSWQFYPVAGFSSGQPGEFKALPMPGVFPVPNGTHFIVQPDNCSSNLSLSENGIVSLPASAIPSDCPLVVRVTDRRGISTVREFSIRQKGVLAELAFMAGGDSILHAGEQVQVHLKLRNSGDSLLQNLHCQLSLHSSNAQLNDSNEIVSLLPPDTLITIQQAFNLSIDSLILDHDTLLLHLNIVQAGDTFEFSFMADLRAAKLGIGKIMVADGNDNILSPGESAAVIAGIRNEGGIPIQQLRGRLFTWNPYIQILSDSIHIQQLGVDSTTNGFFLIQCASNTPIGQLVVFRLELESGNGGEDTLHFFLIVGEQMETFESGGFTAYPWQFSGNSPWLIDSVTVFRDQYSARSASIIDNQSSELFIVLNVLNDDVISFQRKVDCEPDNTNHNYDYLLFSIDGVEQARWDGNKDWTYVEFPVSMGSHAFKWTYRKDYSVSTGQDRAWLDDIRFPVYGVLPPLAIYEENKKIPLMVNAWPNPGDGLFQLRIVNNNESLIKLRVLDAAGRQLWAGDAGRSAPGEVLRSELDLRHLESRGLLFLVLSDSEGGYAVLRLIRQ
jgi:hypothetical protein